MNKLISITAVSAALALATGGLAIAQQAAPEYDASKVVTLEGVTETVYWSTTGGKLILKPNIGSALWVVALPDTRTLLAKGLSADVLARGTPVKIRAYQAKDPACQPNCLAQAIEIALGSQGENHVLLQVRPTS